MAEDEVKQEKHKPGPLRTLLRIVLFVILAVMIWRLIHDRFADKQYRVAGERIEKLQEENNAASGEIKYGPADVREAIGHDSVTGKPEVVDYYYRELYTWQRGIPWMRYYICVIYRKVDGEPKFYNAFQGYEPGSESLPVKPGIYGDRVERDILGEQGGAANPPKQGTDDGGQPDQADPDQPITGNGTETGPDE